MVSDVHYIKTVVVSVRHNIPCGGGIDTSTVDLRVVRGDEREPSARGYNSATLFLGDINTRTWPSRLGESQELGQ
jgi:hypothetical protein